VSSNITKKKDIENMHTISNTVNRKFIDSVDLSNLEIATDTGWQPITSIHKTIPYTVWKIKTSSGKFLECADNHILFDSEYNEIFVKDLIKNQSKVLTVNGAELVTDVVEQSHSENMFDLTVDSKDHRFYTNNILSHNTTIVNALSYAFYGQALTNIKKDNLINKINGKNMIVSVNFEINGIKYRVERGRRPTLLKFYINDKEQDVDDIDESQGDSRKTQESISNLLGMTHTMFKHVVALNTYTEPFLSLRASEQREVIEQLLGITLLSEKAEVLKNQIRDVKDSIIQETANIEAIKSSNDKINNTINSLKLKQTAWNNQKEKDIEKIAKAIESLESLDIEQELLDHDNLKNWLSLHEKIKNLNKEKSTFESTLMQAQKATKKAKLDFEKLQSHKCHACGQKLHDDKQAEMISEISNHLRDCENYEHEIVNKLSKIDQDLEQLGDNGPRPNTFYEDFEEAYNHKSNLQALQHQIETKFNDNDPFQEQIVELSSSAIQKVDWTNINELTTLKDHQEFLLKLLTNKDSFIRKKIIDQNLSFLNQRLTYYLEQSGLPHQVVFQNDLQVEISQLGQDLDFDNLSRGERNRLILSMSWAFRDMWENLYQPINLLFIDELIDNGLDAAGVENALSILKAMARERSKNIYLISHKDELIGRVNNVLKVIKENGYTTYSNDLEVLE
jgi:DNA repair exonuclease SbcCD ATPase subunit